MYECVYLRWIAHNLFIKLKSHTQLAQAKEK